MLSFKHMARASVLKMVALRSMNCLRFGTPELPLEESAGKQNATSVPPSRQITFMNAHDDAPASPAMSGEFAEEGEVYLVAVKATELRLDALRWVLMHEVQSGDTVYVHGIVEEIRTDMGVKYRVNELAFNGVKWRKLDAMVQLMEQKLNAEIAKYESTCRMKDVRLRVKVVAASPAEDSLAASAKVLGATMLLVDKRLQTVGKACARDPDFPDNCAVLLIDGAKCTTIRLALTTQFGAQGVVQEQQPASPLPAFAVRRQEKRLSLGSATPDTHLAPKTAPCHRSSPSDGALWVEVEGIPPNLPRVRVRTEAESQVLSSQSGTNDELSLSLPLPSHEGHPGKPHGCQGCAHCLDVNGAGVYRPGARPSALPKPAAQREEVVVRLRSFSWQELEEATGGFPSCKLLGKGGFGHVYQGVLDDQPVAVKVLKALSQKTEKQFEAEVQLLGGLRHPNIVTLVGYCRADTERLLVYNLSPEGSLDQHLYGPKWPLTWEQRSRIVVGLAMGMAYLHSRAIVHCDLRPSNVLLAKDFRPMVSDFGLAQHLTKEEMAKAATAMGSFGYMDPEYLCTGNLTSKVDVYAFGVIILGIITGTRPFDRNAPLEPKTILQLGQSSVRQCMSLAEQLGDKMVDPRLERKYNPQEVKQFMHLALMCINHKGSVRPSMADILDELQRYRRSEVLSLGR